MPLLARIVPLLRQVLRIPLTASSSSASKDMFLAGVSSLQALSLVVGPALNPHLSQLLQAVAQKNNDKNLSPAIQVGESTIPFCSCSCSCSVGC